MSTPNKYTNTLPKKKPRYQLEKYMGYLSQNIQDLITNKGRIGKTVGIKTKNIAINTEIKSGLTNSDANNKQAGSWNNKKPVLPKELKNYVNEGNNDWKEIVHTKRYRNETQKFPAPTNKNKFIPNIVIHNNETKNLNPITNKNNKETSGIHDRHELKNDKRKGICNQDYKTCNATSNAKSENQPNNKATQGGLIHHRAQSTYYQITN